MYLYRKSLRPCMHPIFLIQSNDINKWKSRVSITKYMMIEDTCLHIFRNLLK